MESDWFKIDGLDASLFGDFPWGGVVKGWLFKLNVCEIGVLGDQRFWLPMDALRLVEIVGSGGRWDVNDCIADDVLKTGDPLFSNVGFDIVTGDIIE